MINGRFETGLVTAAALALFTLPAHATEIHVMATGAVSGAFSKLVPQFEQATGDKVVISWGPSFGTSKDALPVRLKDGEAVDVAVMVGSALDRLIVEGKFTAASRVDLAQSGIGVGIRTGAEKPDIHSAKALKTTLLNAASIGYSEGASGTYIANTLLPKLGISDQVRNKSLLIKGKELVGVAVARGTVQLGLQQTSELRAVPGVDYVGPLPRELQKNSLISAAIATDSINQVSTKAFIAYLSSPAATHAFEESGLDPLSSST